MYFEKSLHDERGSCLQLAKECQNFPHKRKSFKLLNICVEETFCTESQMGEKKGHRLSIPIKTINWPHSIHIASSVVLPLCALRLLAEE